MPFVTDYCVTFFFVIKNKYFNVSSHEKPNRNAFYTLPDGGGFKSAVTIEDCRCRRVAGKGCVYTLYFLLGDR